jgi:single-strand DNA-binding protein
VSSLNRCEFIGNVGKDPEVRYTQGGDPIASFSIACTEKWTAKGGGQKQQRTEWVNCVVFGALAKVVREYVTKGKQLYVAGSLRTEEWTGKDGQKKKAVKINVRELVMLGGARRNDSTPDEEPEGAREPGGDDDLPF